MKTKEIVIRFTDNSGIIFNYLDGTDNIKHIYLKLNGWKIFEGRDDIAVFQDSFLEYVNKILYGFATLILLAIAVNILEFPLLWMIVSVIFAMCCSGWCLYWNRRLSKLIKLSLYLNHFQNMIDDVQEWREKNGKPPFRL